jgi:hypothetical protein
VEAFVQFFLGRYSEDLTYEDDLLVSLQRNLTSVSGFWFDCVTSIPWSYMDLHQYLVRPLRRRRARSVATTEFPLLSLDPSLICTHPARRTRVQWVLLDGVLCKSIHGTGCLG